MLCYVRFLPVLFRFSLYHFEMDGRLIVHSNTIPATGVAGCASVSNAFGWKAAGTKIYYRRFEKKSR